MKSVSRTAWVVAFLGLAACAPEVTTEEGNGEGGGAGGGPTSSAGPNATVGGATTSSAGPGGSVAQGSTGVTTAGVGQGGGEGGGGEGGAGQGGAGEGGAASDLCARTAQIEITSVALDEESWLPGEDRQVLVTLLSAEDHLDYPGVEVVSDNPYVWSANPQNFFFGLLAGEPNTLAVSFHAEDFLEIGTPVHFDVHVVALNAVCEGTATAVLDLTLE